MIIPSEENFALSKKLLESYQPITKEYPKLILKSNLTVKKKIKYFFEKIEKN